MKVSLGGGNLPNVCQISLGYFKIIWATFELFLLFYDDFPYSILIQVNLSPKYDTKKLRTHAKVSLHGKIISIHHPTHPSSWLFQVNSNWQ